MDKIFGKIPEILKLQVIFFLINYFVENGGVLTGEFQHRLGTLGLCILELKGLKCSFKLRDIA